MEREGGNNGDKGMTTRDATSNQSHSNQSHSLPCPGYLVEVNSNTRQHQM